MQRAAVTYFVMGVLTAAIGLAMLLAMAGVFGQPAHAVRDDSPAFGWLCGFIFFAGGLSVITKSLYGAAALQESELPPDAPRAVRFLYGALGLAIVLSLAAVISWVAIGPGERHFSGSGAFLGETIGRAAFGLFALLIWLALGVSGIRWLRRQLLRKRASGA